MLKPDGSSCRYGNEAMRLTRVWRRLDLSPPATLAVAGAIAAAFFVIWFVFPGLAVDLLPMLAVPVALCAVALGLRGGLAAALLGSSITALLYVEGGHVHGAVGFGVHASSLLVLGVFVGHFVDERRRLEAQVARHEELSPDLICTADFDGRFTRVNPAWTRTLGYRSEELLERPFLDFVHPDDRQATIAEAERQTRAGEEVLHFENRYRHADGSYRWLEWSSRPDPERRQLIAVAREVTERKEAEETVRRYQELLEAEVQERTAELEEARIEILNRLALAAEYRDDDTYEHTERVAATSASLLQALGASDEEVALIRQAAPLHDLGKLGVSDTILLKPGRLTPEELARMKLHTRLGAQILSGSRSDVLRLAEQIALTHHEWWDGSGYPSGLAGSEIPLAGRVVALADVFDALTHRRPYKEAWPVERAVEEVRSLAGRQFDPAVVEAFFSLDPHALARGDGARDGLAAA